MTAAPSRAPTAASATVRMNFTYKDDGHIDHVTLVLSWNEFDYLAQGAKIHQALDQIDFWTDELTPEQVAAMVKRFDDLDGDGEDSRPIDVKSLERG